MNNANNLQCKQDFHEKRYCYIL